MVKCSDEFENMSNQHRRNEEQINRMRVDGQLKKGEFAKGVWKKHTHEWEISKRMEIDTFERELKGRMRRLLKKKKTMNGKLLFKEIEEEIMYERFVPLDT